MATTEYDRGHAAGAERARALEAQLISEAAARGIDAFDAVQLRQRCGSTEEALAALRSIEPGSIYPDAKAGFAAIGQRVDAQRAARSAAVTAQPAPASPAATFAELDVQAVYSRRAQVVARAVERDRAEAKAADSE